MFLQFDNESLRCAKSCFVDKKKLGKNYRYVDDTFLIVDKKDVELIFNIFNNYDPHLKFTHEIENNKSISFLDVLVINDNNNIVTDWYQKSVYSGRVIHFKYSHPLYQKKNIIYNLVDRSFLLSNKKFHNKNRTIIKDILLRNKYPLDFINLHIKNRINKLFYVKKDVHIHKNNENHSFKILSIPESLNPSKLSKLFEEHNIRILPLHHKPLQNIIKYGKQVSDLLDHTNVVYRIECK